MPNPTIAQLAHAVVMRKEWSDRHSKTHSTKEHEMLRKSGHLVTPEALERLVAFGIAPVSDIVLSDEHRHAALQANRTPSDDCERRL